MRIYTHIMCIYIYICIDTCVYIYMLYIYVYIHITVQYRYIHAQIVLLVHLQIPSGQPHLPLAFSKVRRSIGRILRQGLQPGLGVEAAAK